MSDARREILDRIRGAVGARPQACDVAYGAIARHYRMHGELSAGDRLALFVSRIEDYDGVVHPVAAGDVAGTIGAVLAARGKRRLVVPAGFPAEHLPGGVEFIRDHDLAYEALDRSDGAVTACTVAIALTGTIVLCHGPAEGRRALTLVPDFHLCVVRAAQIVETVPEAIRRLQQVKPPLVTTISGPSATADIEMTRISGVHGPRTLGVILVRD